MRVFPIILFTMILTGCSAPTGPTTVDRVKDNIILWDDDVVTIDGWLGKCSGLDCAIFPTQAAMTTVQTAEPGSIEWAQAYETALSIGFDAEFDRSAEPLQFRAVRLVARADSICTLNACTDRAPDLHPIKIEQSPIISKAE